MINCFDTNQMVVKRVMGFGDVFDKRQLRIGGTDKEPLANVAHFFDDGVVILGVLSGLA